MVSQPFISAHFKSIINAIHYLCSLQGVAQCCFITCTDKGQPQGVVRSIKPVWNNFVFFEVNLVSFHQVIRSIMEYVVTVCVVLLSCQQVSEILCAGKTRLSINGWFHGNPIGRPAASHESPLQYWSPMPLEVMVCVYCHI